MDEATYPNFLYLQQEAEAGYSPGSYRWPEGVIIGRIGARTRLIL